MQRYYKQDKFSGMEVAVWRRVRIPPPLQVVRGDKKGTQCPRDITRQPVPGGYKYRYLALQVGGISL
jgi:hypothetical protein